MARSGTCSDACYGTAEAAVRAGAAENRHDLQRQTPAGPQPTNTEAPEHAPVSAEGGGVGARGEHGVVASAGQPLRSRHSVWSRGCDIPTP